MPKNLASRVRPQLSPGGRHGLPEDHEPTLTTQRLAHGRLFRTEQRLIEATGRAEGLAGAEEEATARQPNCPVERDRDGSEHAAVGGKRPSKRNAQPPPTAPPRIAAIAARTAASVTTVSASTNTSISPFASLAPALRVAAIWRHFTETTRAPCSRAIAAVRSVDASSTTMTSTGSPSACAAWSIALNVRPRSRSSL